MNHQCSIALAENWLSQKRAETGGRDHEYPPAHFANCLLRPRHRVGLAQYCNIRSPAPEMEAPALWAKRRTRSRLAVLASELRLPSPDRRRHLQERSDRCPCFTSTASPNPSIAPIAHTYSNARLAAPCSDNDPLRQNASAFTQILRSTLIRRRPPDARSTRRQESGGWRIPADQVAQEAPDLCRRNAFAANLDRLPPAAGIHKVVRERLLGLVHLMRPNLASPDLLIIQKDDADSRPSAYTHGAVCARIKGRHSFG
jgi:hypothetical protein